MDLKGRSFHPPPKTLCYRTGGLNLVFSKQDLG
jgi:hypothetical protein